MSEVLLQPLPKVFTVLVVDDSPLERNLVKALFLQRGFRVVEAPNGAEALVALTRERPDAVVADGVMPVLDGYQFCRLLKDDPATRSIPLILLTGQAVGLSRFWARTCGADRFLLKGRDSTGIVEATVALLADRSDLRARENPAAGASLPELGQDAIQARLGKALEHQLLETAMRDTIGHLDTLESTAPDTVTKVLELLHELVLPGAIHLVFQGDQGALGFGLYGAAAGAKERADIEALAHRSIGLSAPWPSTWEPRPPLQEAATGLLDPVLLSLPVGLPDHRAAAWLTLYLGRLEQRAYERLFEVACHELGRVLDLAESRRQLLQAGETLRQAQKLESLALMAGGIAHDFNNLFQSILGNLELASMSATQEREKQALARAMVAVEKGVHMGRRLAESSGSLGWVGVPTDLNAVVRTAVGTKPHWPVVLALGEDLPLVAGDSNQLQRALTHLLENAAEASDSDSGPVTVTTHRVEGAVHPEGRWFTDPPSGPRVELVVTDTGSGASEAVLARMFDPFFSTKQFGRGMGLAATLGILKAHHAALLVHSRVGEGTTFHIWLPLAT